MIGWAAFIMPGTTFLPQAGIAGSLLAFAAAAVAMSLIALNYHYMSNLHPEVGGLYPLVKASINQHVAFSAGWAMGLAHMCCVSLNARAMGRLVRTALEEISQSFFHVYLFGKRVQLIDTAIVIIAIVIFGLINASGIRQTARIQTIGALVLITGILVMLFAAACNVSPDINVFKPLNAPNVSHAAGFIAVFALTPWAYVGFDSLCSVSQEINFSKKRLGRIMVISVLCGTIAYVANILTAVLGVPATYGSWPNYLDALKDRPGFKSYPVLMAAKGALGSTGTAIFLISCFSAVLTGLIGFFTSVSRLLFHMAQDEALPPSLAKVHPTRGTPYNAVRAVVVIAFVLYLLLSRYNCIEELASTATAMGYGLCSLAALREALQQRNRFYIFTGAAGVLTCLLFLFLLLIPIKGLNTPISQQGMFFIAVWIFLGISVYTFSRRKKINL